MKAQHASLLLLVTLTASAAQAAVTVTDNGLIVPTLGSNDTGYIAPTTNQRFGWDSGEGFTQSFTTPTAGTIGSIFLGYNAFDNGDTITLTLSVNGSVVQSGIFLNGNNFSGTAVGGTPDGNGGPNYWMEFDLSSENVAVTAGLNSFSLLATANTGISWAFAPRLNQGGNPYSGGALSQIAPGNPYNPPANSDMAFAVTLVTTPIPEPSTGLLALFASSALLLRRRRA